MQAIALVYIPCPSVEVAQKLATMALESACAGCVNMWPITSMYREQGDIKTDHEVALLMKTVISQVDPLVALIEKNHPYVIPCIIISQGTSNEPYANWLEEVCS